MLWEAGQERLRRESTDDFERMVAAVATGLAVGSDPKAWRAWQDRHDQPARRDPAAQAATIARLGMLFPGSVTRRS